MPGEPRVFLIGGVAISTAVAWLSWQLYERHFLKLKRYFRSRPPRPAPASAGDAGALPPTSSQHPATA